MQILAVHTPKGGSSKTTLVRELAVAASATSSVLMADLDPQGTLTGWYRRRKAGEPKLVQLDPESLNLRALKSFGAELLVVDTPPGYPAWSGRLLRLADAVLVPVRPTPDDLLAAAPIAQALTSRNWCFVLTQVPPRSRLAAQAVRTLAGLGRVAPASLGFRADFPTAAIDGRAAVEYAGTKAAGDVMEVLQYVLKHMLQCGEK